MKVVSMLIAFSLVALVVALGELHHDNQLKRCGLEPVVDTSRSHVLWAGCMIGKQVR
jgi:hypothetical protein